MSEKYVAQVCESARDNLRDALSKIPQQQNGEKEANTIPSVEKILQKVRLNNENEQEDSKYFIISVVEGEQREETKPSERKNLTE